MSTDKTEQALLKLIDRYCSGDVTRSNLEAQLRAALTAAPPAQQQSEPSAQAVALPQDVRDFLQSVAGQPKSKPDYWSSCWQCESNQSKAEDLLAATPPPLQEPQEPQEPREAGR